MIKFFVMTICLLSAVMANAQLEVDSLGNTYLGWRYVSSTIRDVTTMTITAPVAYKNALYLQNEGPNGNNSETHSVINALSKSYRAKYAYGLKSIVYTNSSNTYQAV